MLQTGSKAAVFSLFLSVSVVCTTSFASAHYRHVSASYKHLARSHATHRMHWSGAGGSHVIQCVAFARADAGIDLSGNARDWWDNAAGLYARGQRPESGSVLSFRANGRMPLGHVAVVASIEDDRTIVIDQSHWNSRGITRNIQVKDVSENNDWSAVRVQLARAGSFGSIYPTHGFIYPRPEDDNTVPAQMAHSGSVAGGASLGSGVGLRRNASPEVEVAELPRTRRGLDLTVPDNGPLARR